MAAALRALRALRGGLRGAGAGGPRAGGGAPGGSAGGGAGARRGLAGPDHAKPQYGLPGAPGRSPDGGGGGTNWAAWAVGLVGGSVALQVALPNPVKNFYERSFLTDRRPEDLAEFFGGERLMEVFCLELKPLVDFLMRSGYWDDDGVYHTFGLPFGRMAAHIEFEENEQDTRGDGEADCTLGYVKRERFHDTIWGWTLWDQVTNFGFERTPDGRYKCYQQGEYYIGVWPMRVVFQLHSIVVAWIMERHINGPHFATEESEGSDEVVVKQLNVSADVFDAFLEGLSHDLELSVQHLEDVAKKSGAEDSPIAMAAKQAGVDQGEVLAQLNKSREKMKPFLHNRLPNGERPPFRKVRSYVRRTKPGSENPGKDHSEYTLLIEDKEMKNAVTVALDKLQQNRKSESDALERGRNWSMRQVTPTWVDGRKLDPRSNAWSQLVAATITATLGQTEDQLASSDSAASA